MHLMALVEHPEHVCCRYRLTAFGPALQRAGHTLQLLSYPRSWWEWLTLRRRLQAADAVVVQRKLPSRWQLRLLRTASRCLLFDFDDAIFLRDSYSPRGLHSARRLRRFHTLMGLVNAVLAGNSYLQAQAALVVGADRAHLMPTCVDHTQYPMAGHQGGAQNLQLVWIGSASTMRGLAQIAPILEEVGRRMPGTRLKLICDTSMPLRNLTVIHCPWSAATEATELATADVGISWMPDDDWSRGKCGLKVLQYQAAGLPVLANPVGVHTELLRPGESGFLVDTVEQWLDALKLLARDPGLRRQMGHNGRQQVCERYSVTAGADRWVTILHTLAHSIRAA